MASAQAPAPAPAQTTSAPVPAPEDADERARALFQQGMAAARRHDYTRAVEAFDAVLAVRKSPNVAYNAAAALFELRRYQEAYARVAEVLSSPDELSPEVSANAHALDRRLRPHVALLRVLTSGAQGAVTLSIDGQSEPAAAWAAGRAVEPGTHLVAITDAAGHTSERQVEASLGGTSLVDVHLVSLAASPGAAAPAAPSALSAPAPAALPERSDAARSRAWKLWTGVAVGVVAVAAVGVGVGLALRNRGSGGGAEGQSLEPGVLTW